MKARFRGSVARVEPGPDGKGVKLTLSAVSGDGRSGPVPPGFDPWTAKFTLPEILANIGTPALGQWTAAQQIQALRPAIEAGEGIAVLSAVSFAARHGLVLPNWLAEAYLERFRRFHRHEVASLDEAFHHEPTTDRLRAAQADRKSLLPEVSKRLVEAVQANPEVAIDNALFEAVGRRLGIGKTLCRELYDEGVRDHGYQNLRKLKQLFKLAKKSSESQNSPVRRKRV